MTQDEHLCNIINKRPNNMLKHDIPSIITYSKEMHLHCEAWKNAAMGAQYCVPIKTLNRYLLSDPTISVLDWGCGDGHFSYLLNKKAFMISSYSFTELGPMQSILKNLNNTFTFDKSESQHPVKLPYPNEKFDAVFSVGVLEHVREFGGDEIASLHEINRILKPGGYCFIFHLPNKYSWNEFLHRVLMRFKLVNKYIHNHLYSNKEIYELAKITNFSVTEISLYNVLPRNIFKKLPAGLGNNRLFVSLVSAIERVCSFLFYYFSQNYCVVLQKN